ncbi:MAG: nicotinate-nucleotide adenylyltransferase [Planctomycetota bacterium]
MRLGIFGGSFDPIHNGHLLLADCCVEQRGLDTLWLVPTCRQPFKPRGPVASDEARLAMLRAAIAGRERLGVSTIELERGGTSYTVDTLERIAAEHPDAKLFLAMGADTLADLPHWKDPRRVCELATPMAVGRAGFGATDFCVLEDVVPAERLGEIAAAAVTMPAAEVSSSAIRRAVAAGRPWREHVPKSVAAVIDERQLYRG